MTHFKTELNWRFKVGLVLIFSVVSLNTIEARAISHPTLSAIYPNSGPENISPYPTLHGSNLEKGAKLYINGVLARGEWYGCNSGCIVFQPPLSAVKGAVSVKVVNPDGGTVTANGLWSYTTASQAKCAFAGKTLTYNQPVTAYKTANVPAGSTCTSQTRVCVSNNDLTGSYSYASCSAAAPVLSQPTISAIYPNSGPETISPYPTLHGTNFQSGAKLYVNGILARGSWQNGTTVIVFQPPLSAVTGPVPVKIVNPDGGTVTLNNAWSYTTASQAKCSFNGKTLSFNQSVTAYEASSVPAGSTCSSQTRVCAGNNDLTGSYLYASCSAAAPVLSQPTISAIYPNSGPETISPYPTLHGTNFQSGAKLYVNGILARGSWQNGTTIIVFQPPLSNVTGPVSVKIVNPDGGTTTLANGWTYLASSGTGSSGGGSGGGGSSGGGGGSSGGGGSNSSGGPNFPRLGGVYLGGPQKYDSSFQSFAAKLNMVIIGGNWQGWNPGYTKEQVITSIKSQSHVGTKVFQYVDLNEAPVSSGGWFPTYVNEVNKMNWWVYMKGSSGSRVQSTFNSAFGLIDMTSYVAKDPSTGLGPYQWGAKFVNDYFHLGTYSGSHAAPDLDGFFLDNVFTYPQASQGDWLRNGTTQSNMNSSVDTALMQGESTFAQYIHSVWPSATVICNSGDAIGSGIDKGVNISPLKDQFQGGLVEAAVGTTWSIDTWGGSKGLMRWYTNTMNNIASPKLEEFNVHNMTSDGRIPSSSSSYQGLRYSLTAALMNNGYYSTDTTDGNYADTASNYLWFDEYDGGGIGEGYLGQPLSTSAGAAQTTAWQNGVWKREFQHGIALWNPRGNGTQTISLSGLGNLKHICGKQETNVNNCKSVTNGSVTLHDEDGVILLRY